MLGLVLWFDFLFKTECAHLELNTIYACVLKVAVEVWGTFLLTWNILNPETRFSLKTEHSNKFWHPGFLCVCPDSSLKCGLSQRRSFYS